MKPRLISQIIFLSVIIIVTVLAIQSIHAYCPFGGVETIYQFITTGAFIQKIHDSSVVLMIIGILIALLFGAAFCGWICPFGTIQEFVGKLGKKIFKKRYNRFIPKRLDNILRYLRYIVLIWVIYVTATSAKLIFESYDPYSTLFRLFNDEIAIGGLVILIFVIFLSLFVERPWCKYACPYGAVLGIFNLFSLFKVRRNPSSCKTCGKCDKACPMNIDVSKKISIKNHQCIRCMECSSEDTCSFVNTVYLGTGGKMNENQ